MCQPAGEGWRYVRGRLSKGAGASLRQQRPQPRHGAALQKLEAGAAAGGGNADRGRGARAVERRQRVAAWGGAGAGREWR